LFNIVELPTRSLSALLVSSILVKVNFPHAIVSLVLAMCPAISVFQPSPIAIHTQIRASFLGVRKVDALKLIGSVTRQEGSTV
jgi:hypothetical protein